MRHYFPGVGVPHEFTMELMKTAIEPKLLHGAAQCTWDMARSELTTSDDNNAGASNIEDQPFFRDVIGQMLKAKLADKPGGKVGFADPDLCFNLDGEKSVKTMHGKNDAKYTSTKAPSALRGGTKQAGTATNSAVGDPPHNGTDDDDAISLSSDDSVESLSSGESGSGSDSSSSSHSSAESQSEDEGAGEG